MKLLISNGIYFGQAAMLVCDACCNKAWGRNNRPRVQVGESEDDYEILPDHELGNAPIDPGTYEGGQAKPTCDAERHNKWCWRECERSRMTRPGEAGGTQIEMEIPDFSRRVFNMPQSEASNG